VTDAVRAFVALPVPAEVITTCVRAQDELGLRFLRGERPRWTRPEQMHVTLKFLGSVSAPDLETAGDLVRQAATGSRPFACPLQLLDAFPTLRRARVVIVSLGSVPVLDDLARTLQVSFARLGVPTDERAFSPHITLARLRRPLDLRPYLDKREVAPQAVEFERLVLFRSDLDPTGARYTPVTTVRLGPDS
jgi:2'-5' RNA ligase